MTQVIKALIYLISTQGHEIESVVISRDVIGAMGHYIEDGAFGTALTFDATFDGVVDTVSCIHNGRTIRTYRPEPQFYLAGIPVKISPCDNTCSIIIRNGDIIELIPHTDEICEDEITFEAEELERIWYGGF